MTRHHDPRTLRDFTTPGPFSLRHAHNRSPHLPVTVFVSSVLLVSLGDGSELGSSVRMIISVRRNLASHLYASFICPMAFSSLAWAPVRMLITICLCCRYFSRPSESVKSPSFWMIKIIPSQAF